MKKEGIALGLAMLVSCPGYAGGYFDMSMLPNVPCKYQMSRPKTDRNQSKYFSQCDFDKRIKLSGSVRASTGIGNDIISIGNNDALHKLTFNTNLANATNTNVESSSDAWLHHARLNIDAVIGRYAEAHVSTVFRNERNLFSVADASYYNRFSGSYMDDLSHGSIKQGNVLPIDEANVVLGNFTKTPFYIRFGRQYMDFGWYDKDVPIATMTQLISQSSNDAVTIGMVDVEGLSASVSGFRSVSRDSVFDDTGGITEDHPETHTNNFNASVAYGIDFEYISIDAKADYMMDLYGIDFFDGYNGNGIVGKVLSDPHSRSADPTQRDTILNIVRPNRATPAFAFTLNTHVGDFDFFGQYVGAIRMIDKGIWSKGGLGNSPFNDSLVDGMRPHAFTIEFGYSFPISGRDTRISLNMQRTRDLMAGNFNESSARDRFYYIPSQRFQLNIEHNFMSDFDISLNYIRDKDYNNSQFHRLGNTSADGGAPGDIFDAANIGGNYQGTDNHNEFLVISIVGHFN